MHLENSVKLDFKDVLIRPKRSTLTSRSEVDITREFKFLHSSEPYHGIPIIAANMDTTGTFEMASALGRHKMSTALHKHYTAKEYVDFFQKLENKSDAFYSLGIGEHDWQKFREVMAAAPGAIRYVCIDVANGYTEAFVAFVKKVRETYPDIVLMAGNVVTGGRICADGGCTVPGDIAKAFGGGADFVMLGGMLAGHDEAAGDVVTTEDGVFKRFYGMSSRNAMDKYAGGVAKYRAAEGKAVLIPARGPVESTIQDILGGVRSACTYVGARRLKELTMRTTFVRVSMQLNEVFGKAP